MMAKELPPLVSIVTPVYNAGRFIEQTIASVQAQTYENWEMILIDDLSTDDSIAIIENLQKSDRRIRLIKSTENMGAASSRNIGLDASKGRYIAFLDADDLWVHEKLEVQVSFALSCKKGFVFSSYQFADLDGKPTSSPVTVPKSIDYRRALRNHIIWTSTVLIDTMLVPQKLIIMPDVRRGQDAATWWQILRETNTPAYGIQKPLAYYRRTSDSLSANKLNAVKRTWYLYRNVEGLGVINSAFCFCFYAVNAIRKRI